MIRVHLYAVVEGHHVQDEIHYYSWNVEMFLVNSLNQNGTGDSQSSWVNQKCYLATESEEDDSLESYGHYFLSTFLRSLSTILSYLQIFTISQVFREAKNPSWFQKTG